MIGAGTRMASEMAEQPAVLRGLLTERGERQRQLRAVAPDPLRGLVLVARGSSDNAAVYGRYVLEHALQVPVVLAAPSLQTRYGVTPHLDGFLVVAISQSGSTPEIVDTMQRLAAGGAGTLAITNVAGSDLARAADATILLGAGDERAVPATKTFTAQLAALALVAEALAAEPQWPAADWERVVAAVEEVLDTPEDVEGPARALAAADHAVQVGRGFLFGVALEAGLKIAETTGLTVHGFSPADLRHGPIASTRAGVRALCFCSPGPTVDDVAQIAAELARRGAEVTAVSPDPTLVPDASEWLAVPGGITEQLAAFPHVVRAQQLALATATLRGIDADQPFSLTKVTPTH